MSKFDEVNDPEQAKRRAVEAANTWYPSEGGLRDYVAVALAAATVVGAAMVWSVMPAIASLAKAEVEAADRFQFYFAFGSLLGAPALGWILWWSRKNLFALALLVVFGLAVGAMLPLTRV